MKGRKKVIKLMFYEQNTW